MVHTLDLVSNDGNWDLQCLGWGQCEHRPHWLFFLSITAKNQFPGFRLGVMAYAWNPITQEVKTKGL